MLNKHDVISISHRPHAYSNGNFQFYRVSDRLLKLYEGSKSWRNVFTSGQYIVFDEWWNNFPYGPPKIEDMSLTVNKAAERGDIRFFNPMDHGHTQWLANSFVGRRACWL